MRWDDLFDDLEAQLDREMAAEESGLAAEEERLRLARLPLRERIRALADNDRGEAITLRLRGGALLRTRVQGVGADWVSGELATGSASVVVPLGAVAGLSLPPARVLASLGGGGRTERGRAARTGLPVVLRDLARRRLPVEVVTVAGALAGTIDRAAAETLDLAVHPSGTPRRADEVRTVEVIPLAAVDYVLLP